MKKRKPNRARGGNAGRQSKATDHAVYRHAQAARTTAPSDRRPMPAHKVMVSAARTREDGHSLAILLTPFLIVAAALAGQQALRMPERSLPELAVRREPVQSPAALARPGPAEPGNRAVAVAPPTSLAAQPPARPSADVLTRAERTTALLRRGAIPADAIPQRTASLDPAYRPDIPILPPSASAPPLPEASAPAMPPAPPQRQRQRVLVKRAPLPKLAPIISRPLDHAAPEGIPLQKLSLLDPTLRQATPALSRAEPPMGLPAPITPSAPALCTARDGLFDRAPAIARPMPPPDSFGTALAAAARRQLDELVIYNARYTRIGFPMGDVASLFGVCSDVIVRAYRVFGIDLQALIVATKTGTGDPHIDHRRVEVIRQFLERQGAALPITDLAEDYRPGDIVTYYRPQNRTSKSHIGLVTDLVAPSGRPLIIHNRGWGPQLEDALFVDRITGHYRFAGITQSKPVQPRRTVADGSEAGADTRTPVTMTSLVPSAHPQCRMANGADQYAATVKLAAAAPSNACLPARARPLSPSSGVAERSAEASQASPAAPSRIAAAGRTARQ